MNMENYDASNSADVDWVVNIKGGPGETFEISVLRNSNEHGKRSYGWFDKDKIYISGSDGPGGETVSQSIWDRLVSVAQEVAAEMNAA